MNAILSEIALHDLADTRLGRVLVLTVNNRHARRLLAQLSALLDDARPVMAVPDIVPFRAWVRQAAEQLAFVEGIPLAAYRLDTFGSQILWQQVIRETEPEHYLLDIAQAARLAREADQLMSTWQLTVPESAATPDYQRFAAWRAAYRRHLELADAEDETLGLERVGVALAQGELRLQADTVVMAGFNEFSPLQQQMLDSWRHAGAQVLRLAENLEPASALCRVCAPSVEQEWRWAAAWAHRQLRQHPEGCFAILAPQLESQAALAHRLLHARLSADGFTYNIAVARPLAEWPLVRAALAWLNVMVECVEGPCAPAVAGRALLAGHCAAHVSEAGARAALDARWRHDAVLSLTRADLSGDLHEAAPRLARAWESVLDLLPAARDSDRASGWAARFKSLLSALGFPGEGVLDSAAHQVLEAFEMALDAFGRQHVVLQDIDFDQALRALRALLQQTAFQPQRDPGARLDVLGLLEAEGGRWDGVWILGLTDDVLPAAPNPNPFVPLAVQRHAGTPRATPERELEWARASFDMLRRCASQIVVSSAAFDGERELRPSPFIADLALSEPASDDNGMLVSGTPVGGVIETIEDDWGPALAAGQPTTGGVAVLETQARNPLWAFVKYRLRARQLPAYAEPARQTVRGMFLHACAEGFFGLVHSQRQLRERCAGDGTALRQALHSAIQRAAHGHLQAFSPVVRELECERALAILSDWVQRELQRVPYDIIALEEDSVWTHGTLRLKLRVDRVDRLETGERLIIDYKTGAGRLDPRNDWVRRPPLSLQLPLYAAMLGGQTHDVAALALVRLHAREVAVAGLADVQTGLEGLATVADWTELDDLDWGGLMTRWRRDIEELADAYAAGWAANVTRHPSDLEYCDVLPFLRLYEEADDVAPIAQ